MIDIERCKNDRRRLVLIVGEKVWHISYKEGRHLLKKLLLLGVEVDNKEQIVLLKIKSLINHLRYFIKKEHLKVVDDFHRFCRKYCALNK